MPFYEIVYETGSKSVIQADDDKQAMSGIKAHHQRAIAGEPGRGQSTTRSDLEGNAPQVLDYPAERVVKVFKYDTHPADLTADQTMSKDVVKSELDALLKSKSDVVNLMELAADIRDLANPIIADAGRHESMYKMEASSELPLDDLESEE